MIIYELYDPLAKKTIGFFRTEEECHNKAEGLSKYEIVLCHFSLRETQRILTTMYEAIQ